MNNKSKTYKLIITALFTALLSVSVFIRIDVWPVAFTLQTFIVILAGLIIGPLYGSISVTVYIILGLIGLPIFSQGGGFAYVLKPSFGFIIGFILQAFVTGMLFKYLPKKKWRYFVAAGVGMIACYITGLPYMWFILNNVMGIQKTFASLITAYFLPYLLWDSVKAAAAALIAIRLKKSLSII